MEAHLVRLAILAAAISSMGAGYRTQNFVVEAPTPDMAQQIGKAAEKYRRDLAIEWVGSELPNWAQPCPITAQVADHLGAGGATSFVFDHGEVFGWRMSIQGSLVRILDSVLPHEVTHTIFATHFRQPLPRWADEGACTIVEHESERSKQQRMLIDFLRTGHGIAFNRMFAMKEYPHDVMPLYSQGYSVARYLVAHGGKRKFLDYLADGLRDENWNRATQQHYGISDLAVLQNQWLGWVRQGSPALDIAQNSNPPLVPVNLASANAGRPRPASNLIHRQSEPAPTPDTSDVATSEPKNAPSVYELASATKRSSRVAADMSKQGWRAPSDDGEPSALAAVDSEVIEDLAREAKLDAEMPATHQVTRQQEIQRPQQVILEWAKPRAAAAENELVARRARLMPGPAGN